MTHKPDQRTTSFDATLDRLLSHAATGHAAELPHPLPSWTDSVTLLEDLRALMLMRLDSVDARQKLAEAMATLRSLLQACQPACGGAIQVRMVCNDFLAALPDLQQTLHEDTDTALRSDPAVTCRDEVIFCYPGLKALVYYRIARVLYGLGVPLLPRLITEIAHSSTGIDIHPGANIGERFFIDHGTGVVIGATCIIGNDVKLYQGVTLGALSFPKSEEGHIIKGLERHPVIGDRVTIYAGATILGRITIGSDSVIGGNVWVTRDVAPMSHVMQQRPREDQLIHGAGI